jgi:hypothetical protein
MDKEIEDIIKEFDSYDMVDCGSPFQPWQDLKKVKDGEVGEWVDAEDAAREILRLRNLLKSAAEISN